MTKSSTANKSFAPGTSRSSRSHHTLLLEMAKEAQDLAEQGARIAELRDQKGRQQGRHVPQPEAADAIGVTLRAYQTWEAGRGDISRENLTALAAYFDVSSDYIEFGVERPRDTTPNLAGATGAQILAQLKHLNGRVDAIYALLTEDEGTSAAVAELEALPGRLSQADAERKRQASERSAKKKAAARRKSA